MDLSILTFCLEKLLENLKKDSNKDVNLLFLEATDDIIILVKQMLPNFMNNSSEITALDLLLEVD